jgi:hypothetical protein
MRLLAADRTLFHIGKGRTETAQDAFAGYNAPGRNVSIGPVEGVKPVRWCRWSDRVVHT